MSKLEISKQTYKRLKNNQSHRGVTLVLILVFGFIFLLLIETLTNLSITRVKLVKQKLSWEKSLVIAEAGIDYYRWHLAHYPNDYQDGTDQPGPYLHEYKDTSGQTVGYFSLEITPPSGCSPAVEIQSTGWTTDFPNIKRSVKIKYAQPALAKYAFLINTNAWFGDTESLKGPFHSNGGIRMDGWQNSLSTSAKQTYICGSEHGCTSSNCSDPCQWTASGCQCPGIWGAGSGGPSGLWEYPVPAVDFNKITQDLAQLKTRAQESGIYLGNLGLGYHLKFKSDGTFDVYRVKKLKPKVHYCDLDNNCGWSSIDIQTEEFYANYPVPSNCSPIFIEDNVWVDGIINGRATVVAAKLPDTPNTEKNIYIPHSILKYNNQSVLGLIAQKNIQITLYSDDDLIIEAAMLAQKGHICRWYYPHISWLQPYKDYAIRNSITTFGSTISYGEWTYSYVNWSNQIVSGYQNTNSNYDASLTFDPPPYFPVDGDFQTIQWVEEK